MNWKRNHFPINNFSIHKQADRIAAQHSWFLGIDTTLLSFLLSLFSHSQGSNFANPGLGAQNINAFKSKQAEEKDDSIHQKFPQFLFEKKYSSVTSRLQKVLRMKCGKEKETTNVYEIGHSLIPIHIVALVRKLFVECFWGNSPSWWADTIHWLSDIMTITFACFISFKREKRELEIIWDHIYNITV